MTIQILESGKHENGEKHKFKFTQMVQCNIGNPQQLGQKPITFFRQVCRYAACLCGADW